MLRVHPTLPALLMTALVSVTLAPPAGAAGVATGEVTVVIDCMHWGFATGEGASNNPNTVWTFHVYRWSSVKGGYSETQTSTGATASFYAEDPDDSRWLGGTYQISASLYADGRQVDAEGLGCA